MLRRSFIQALGAVFAIPSATSGKVVAQHVTDTVETIDARTADKVVIQIWGDLMKDLNAHDPEDLKIAKRIHAKMAMQVVNAVRRLHGDGRAYAADGGYTLGFLDGDLAPAWAAMRGRRGPYEASKDVWHNRLGPMPELLPPKV